MPDKNPGAREQAPRLYIQLSIQKLLVLPLYTISYLVLGKKVTCCIISQPAVHSSSQLILALSQIQRMQMQIALSNLCNIDTALATRTEQSDSSTAPSYAPLCGYGQELS